MTTGNIDIVVDDFTLADRILAADAAMEVVESTGNVQMAKDRILDRAMEEHICTRWWLWSYLFLVTEGKA